MIPVLERSARADCGRTERGEISADDGHSGCMPSAREKTDSLFPVMMDTQGQESFPPRSVPPSISGF